MNKKKMAFIGGTTVGFIAATYGLWCRRHTTKEKYNATKTKLAKWKKKRITDAFYDTITQEDIAWG